MLNPSVHDGMKPRVIVSPEPPSGPSAPPSLPQAVAVSDTAASPAASLIACLRTGVVLLSMTTDPRTSRVVGTRAGRVRPAGAHPSGAGARYGRRGGRLDLVRGGRRPAANERPPRRPARPVTERGGQPVEVDGQDDDRDPALETEPDVEAGDAGDDDAPQTARADQPGDHGHRQRQH